MIEDPPLLKVRRNFPRPSEEQIAAFRGTPTGYLADAMDGRGALDYRIKPIDPETASFCGVALPCHPGPGDLMATMASLEVAQPGDVILTAADGFMDTATIGDLVLGMMKNRGVAAFVTDGSVRDQTGLRQVGLPCFAAGITPNSPTNTGPGTIGLPVMLGGRAIEAGDIVVGDIDGVVVVPQAMIAQVLERIPAIKAAEAEYEAAVAGGLQVPDRIKGLFASGRVQELD